MTEYTRTKWVTWREILSQPDGPLWAAPLAVLFAQVAGVVWADRMGLNVDDPFAGRQTLTRVVTGVTLYEVRP